MQNENILERFINYVSPGWALSRARSAGILEMMRKYTGASKGPLTEDWYATSASAQAEVSGDYKTLRNRMRELVRNDGFAYAAVEALGNNVVGKGIQPFITGEEAIKKKAEQAFMLWCKSLNCDFTGQNDFFGLQQLVIKTIVQSGDVIVLKRYVGKGKQMQLALQVLESDYLVEWYNTLEEDKFPPGTTVDGGIYYDAQGRVIGYEIYEQHPGDSIWRKDSLAHFFVKASDCLLIFRKDRPGQHRGVPVGHSVMLEHKMLSQYELAQAHKQTVSALFTLFITTTNAAEFGPGKQVNDAKYPDLSGERITPGTLQYLLPGETIQPSNPPSIQGYDEYTKNRIRKIAKGWGLSYAVLSGDMKGASFSSERMGWIEMHRNIESWQTLVMVPKFCSQIWKWWLALEQTKGTLPNNTESLAVDWTPPRREMMDPVKETNAMIAQIRAGMKSWSGVVRELGENPWRLRAEIAMDKSDNEKANLVLESDYSVIHEEKMKGKEPMGAGEKK